MSNAHLSQTDILARLTPVMQLTFNDHTLTVTPELSMDDLPAWDSIGHMALITATEKAFGIQCSLAELVNVENVRSLMALVAKKLATPS